MPLPWLLPLDPGKQEGREAPPGHKESRSPSPLQGEGLQGRVVFPCSQEGEGSPDSGSSQRVSARSGSLRGRGNCSLIRGLKKIRNGGQGASLGVKWLRLCGPNIGCPGSISGQGTRSHMPQQSLKILHGATKTQRSQINKYFKKYKEKNRSGS